MHGLLRGGIERFVPRPGGQSSQRRQALPAAALEPPFVAVRTSDGESFPHGLQPTRARQAFKGNACRRSSLDRTGSETRHARGFVAQEVHDSFNICKGMIDKDQQHRLGWPKSATCQGPPPKCTWKRLGNCSVANIASLLEQCADITLAF